MSTAHRCSLSCFSCAKDVRPKIYLVVCELHPTTIYFYGHFNLVELVYVLEQSKNRRYYNLFTINSASHLTALRPFFAWKLANLQLTA